MQNRSPITERTWLLKRPVARSASREIVRNIIDNTVNKPYLNGLNNQPAKSGRFIGRNLIWSRDAWPVSVVVVFELVWVAFGRAVRDSCALISTRLP